MKSLFIAILFLLLLGFTANAGDFTVTWEPNTEPDLAGYKVYYGNAHGVYNPAIDVGNQTGYIFTALPAGVYYVAVTAYDTSGNESDFSYEVVIPVFMNQVKGLRKEP